MKKLALFFGLALGMLALWLCTAPSVEAQSGYRSVPADPTAPYRKASFESRLWAWLKSSNYEQWAPAPGQTTGFYEGQGPHGAQLKMYLNRTALSEPKNPPHGSIIIKENFNPQQELVAVTVMYRSKGFDPQNNDWYWVKYNPSGTVATKGDVRLAGKVNDCTQCHQGAAGNDYLFFND